MFKITINQQMMNFKFILLAISTTYRMISATKIHLEETSECADAKMTEII